MDQIITTIKQVESLQGQQITARGTYRQLNVHQKAGQTSYIGRVKIDLEDGFLALEADDAGIRPQAEIEKFEGKEVLTTGTLYNMCPLWGDGTQATIVAHCLMDIKRIDFAGQAL